MIFKRNNLWLSIYSLLVFLYMYLPIFVLAFYSFNRSAYNAQWQGFSLKWYARLLSERQLLHALINSLEIGTIAVLIAAILGTMMAVGLSKYRFPGKTLYRGISYLPLIVPDIAIAISTLIFLAVLSIQLSFWTIVASHVVFCLAYIAIVVSSRLIRSIAI